MSDEPGSAGARGRKRPGPTIDLQATEISRGPVNAEPGKSVDPEPAEAGAGPTAPGAEAPPRAEEPDRADPRGPESVAASAEGAGGWRDALPWRVVGAGALGAALVVVPALIAAQLWRSDRDVAALDARLARAEQTLRALETRPSPPRVDPATVDALAGRVDKLEAAAAGARSPANDPALLNRLAALETQLKSLDEKIGIVARRTDDIATMARDAGERAAATAQVAPQAAQRGDIETLGNRIAALERSDKAIEAELGKRSNEADRAARVAMAASALAAAVERGEPFGAQLAVLKGLAPDAKALATLEPFAASGLPSGAVLGRELQALIPALAKAAGTTASGERGFLEKLQANAEKLVRIRPVDEVPGNDPAAVLARVDRRAREADVAGMLAELAKLPSEARAPAEGWIARAQAREAALAAARRLSSDTLGALDKAP